MSIICIRGGEAAAEGREAHTEALSRVAPRVAFGTGVIWLDARGLSAGAVARAAADALARIGGAAADRTEEEEEEGVGAGAGASSEARAVASAGVAAIPSAGVAAIPIAAFVAAGQAAPGSVAPAPAAAIRVVAESAREFLAPLPVGVLGLDARLESLLEGVGVTTCGELAALPREALEVRFGAEVVTPWRWARGEDRRRLFGAPVRTRPHASLDFIDYVVTDPERLLFTANALLGTVCAGLVERGEHARALELRFALADGGAWTRVLRSPRPTADRATWLRRIRAALDRITVADAVTGVWLSVTGTEAAGTVQGDLFDPGFGTAAAVDAALLRLVETREGTLVAPAVDAHPLVERRGGFTALDGAAALSGAAGPPAGLPAALSAGGAGAGADPEPGSRAAAEADASASTGLTLQLLAQPRRVRVETTARRDHHIPVRYYDRGWHTLVTAAGPDRLSGGQWESAYAREYFRAVTADGRLVWLYRDGRSQQWYLHGWWD